MPLSSFTKQNLLLEFASLKYACPEGVYVTITPGEALLWSGILFVKKGPYSPAVLRFQISFPPQFPTTPPLITFSSDIFHPLLTPLTTYTYSTSTSDADTVSASDNERLPPGGFSLRHGFPHWFLRPNQNHPSRAPSVSKISPSDLQTQSSGSAPSVTVYQLLDYLRSAFSDESFLDSITFETAANQGAYHAWQTNRGQLSDSSPDASQQSSPSSRQSSGKFISTSSALRTDSRAKKARKPGEWNWEGVWEERVKRGVQNSLSEPVLYGAAAGSDDLIHFSDMDPDALQGIINDATTRY